MPFHNFSSLTLLVVGQPLGIIVHVINAYGSSPSLNNGITCIVNNELDNNGDEDFPNFLTHSPYYDTDTAIEILSQKNETFKIISLNCQSLPAKYDQIKMYLEIYKNADIKFNDICLQETWLMDNSDTGYLHLDRYTLISKGRKCSNHGGVAIYLDKTFSYTILDIEGNPDIWDGLFIKVNLVTLNRLKNP